jgi:hypothetical protein
MSHGEIWDDSALVDSWNEALEEYKVDIRVSNPIPYAHINQRYHSIHARGEKVEDVLQTFERQDPAS